MSDFLFIFRGGDRPSGSPDEMQVVMQKWMNWMKDLGAKGHLKDMGHPLEPGGKVVRGKSVTDGPFAESKDIVGGYTLIQAKDLAQAAELSKGCPGLEYGGAVEVRPIQEINM